MSSTDERVGILRSPERRAHDQAQRTIELLLVLALPQALVRVAPTWAGVVLLWGATVFSGSSWIESVETLFCVTDESYPNHKRNSRIIVAVLGCILFCVATAVWLLWSAIGWHYIGYPYYALACALALAVYVFYKEYLR